jgi:hypothetical protein
VREKVPIEAVLKYAQISSFRGAGEAARDAVAYMGVGLSEGV